MARTFSSRRYAQAIFQLAQESNDVEKWLDDLTVLAAAVGDKLFASFMDSPQVETEKKSTVIGELFDKEVGGLAVNLMCLLASINAVKNLPSITDSFQELVDEERGIERCEIVSAVGLTEEQRKRISKGISELVGKEITVETRVDEEILGGFVARVGDRLIDGSLKTRFEDMKRELVKKT